MSKAPDLTGRRFGRLVVKERAGSDKRGNALWLCVCDDGNKKTVLGLDLAKGHTKSCGCLRQEMAVITNTKHGHATGGVSPEYVSWRKMIDRCRYPSEMSWKNYGGRGIKICDRWLGEDGFKNFLADLGERPPGTTLGRFGDIGNYEPGNCKWMTSKEQARNRRPRSKKICEAVAA
jgi:hypothetical protein